MDASAWPPWRRARAWEMMPRVAACEAFYRGDFRSLSPQALRDVVLWITGSESQADDAAVARIEARALARGEAEE